MPHNERLYSPDGSLTARHSTLVDRVTNFSKRFEISCTRLVNCTIGANVLYVV